MVLTVVLKIKPQLNGNPQITGFLAGDSDLRAVAVNSLAGYLYCHFYYSIFWD
jgi:hypothetical protein